MRRFMLEHFYRDASTVYVAGESYPTKCNYDVWRCFTAVARYTGRAHFRGLFDDPSVRLDDVILQQRRIDGIGVFILVSRRTTDWTNANGCVCEPSASYRDYIRIHCVT